jgi:hypothetical protein
MTIHGSELENACKFLLQKEITLEVNKKIYKKGKLILFYQKNFYLVFIMKTAKKEKEKIEIPIPYGVEIHEEDNLVFFDYRIKKGQLKNLIFLNLKKKNGTYSNSHD